MKRVTRIIIITTILGFILPSLAHFPAKVNDGKIRLVVIDAGHGGVDPGNLGTGRYKDKEKQIALDVSLLVGKYIEENLPDVKVKYTRIKDKTVALHERPVFANSVGADLFISIHCDAFTSSSAYGCASIVQGKNHNDENMRVAQQENSVILLEDNYEEIYEGFDPNKPETYIMLTMQQNAYFEQSISLAQKVQNQFKNRVHRKDRGVKQQPLYVTSRTTMPAILIELGFLTNNKEEDFLNTQNGKELMASAIYRSFKEYKIERETLHLINSLPDQVSEVAEYLDDKKEKEAVKEDEIVQEIVKIPSKVEDKTTTPDHPIYRVQLATSRQKMELTPQNFKGVSNVEIFEEYHLFKYTHGAFSSLSEAKADLIEIKKAGFSDAWIIAFYKGKKISIKEAQGLNP